MSIWTQIATEIERFSAELRDLPVMPHAMLPQLRGELERSYTFAQALPAATITSDLARLLREGTVHVTHPRYFGLFNPSVRPISIAADALVALYNPQLAAWSHAPAANEIEQLTLRHFMRLLGWDPTTGIANFTSGGAEANLSALLAAIAHRFPESGESGVAGIARRPAIYLTSESHHSFVKIARMTGLGTTCLRLVPTTAQYTLDPDALVDCLNADAGDGWYPLMIVGTAGTTGAGLIDPLARMADIASDHEIWLHVDAAWGGSAVLSPNLRPLLAGIERADSVTWDAHKWLSVPMGAGMFFCRYPEAVKRAFAVSTSYMPSATSGDETIDPYTASIQWSRRAIGLKVFMALAELGTAGYAALIEHQTAMGEQLRRRLREVGWLVVNATPLPVICFSHPDIQAGRCTTSAILRVIEQRNKVWISEVVLAESERVLRACITSFQTQDQDIECLVEELEYARGTIPA